MAAIPPRVSAWATGSVKAALAPEPPAMTKADPARGALPVACRFASKRPMAAPPPPTKDRLEPAQFERLRAALLMPRNAATDPAGPKVEICPWEHIKRLHKALVSSKVAVSNVALEGSGAAHVLNTEAFPKYNDIDIVFTLESGERAALTSIRDIVMASLEEYAPASWAGSGASWVMSGHVIGKMWISPPPAECADQWAIFTLGVAGSSTDLKFVQKIRRPYQFSIDSFRLDLTTLLKTANPPSVPGRPTATEATAAAASTTAVEPAPAPEPAKPVPFSYASVAKKVRPAPPKPVAPVGHVGPSPAALFAAAKAAAEAHSALSLNAGAGLELKVGVSCQCGSLALALEHLHQRRIYLENEDELSQVRGGGLLKYVAYLQKGFSCAESVDQDRMRRYMVNRFLVDYPPFDVNRFGSPVQLQVLTDYFNTHFAGESAEIMQRRRAFLKHLYDLVHSVQKGGVNLVAPLLEAILFMQKYLDHFDQTNAKANLKKKKKKKKSKNGSGNGEEASDSDACSVSSEGSGGTDSIGYPDYLLPEPLARPGQGKGKSRKAKKKAGNGQAGNGSQQWHGGEPQNGKKKKKKKGGGGGNSDSGNGSDNGGRDRSQSMSENAATRKQREVGKSDPKADPLRRARSKSEASGGNAKK